MLVVPSTNSPRLRGYEQARIARGGLPSNIDMASHFNYYSQVPGYYGVDNGGPPLQSDRLTAIPQQFQQYSAEDLNANFPEFEGAAGMMLPAQGSVRGRRRMGSLNEHVKHRRTRSGCYTCRNRRVKCDETHPICDRKYKIIVLPVHG